MSSFIEQALVILSATCMSYRHMLLHVHACLRVSEKHLTSVQYVVVCPSTCHCQNLPGLVVLSREGACILRTCPYIWLCLFTRRLGADSHCR